MTRVPRFLILCSLILGLFCEQIEAQDFIVEGSAKITEMSPASGTAQNVGRESDGTLVLMSSTIQTYSVGDFAQGGVVFWVTPSGQHGKVVSIYDVANVAWSNFTTEVGNSAKSDINGAGNSVATVLQSGHLISAAQECLDLAFAGYDDWYLPAKDELNEIYINRVTINTTCNANGGESFETTGYWSSTEATTDGAEAWNQNFFGAGTQQTDGKGIQFHFRAIRAF